MPESIVEDKRTVVIGASPNPARYAYSAVKKLKEKGHTAIPIGIRNGSIANEEIITGQPLIDNVHTVTIYISKRHQVSLYDYILSLKPSRIVFNPGTENSELAALAKSAGIEVVFGCTLVMLAVNNY